MSRTFTYILIGMTAFLMIGTTAACTGRDSIPLSDQTITLVTPLPVLTETAVPTTQVTLIPIVTEAASLIATAIPVETTTVPTATEIPATATAIPSATGVPATATLAPTSTAVPATATKIPTATAVPPTAIVVYATAVEYVMAQTDLNIRSGPGTAYEVVGWVAEGQIAKVTGVSGDKEWWRVVCPDDSIGSCWITAHPQYTQPTTVPGKTPTATAVPAACSNSAALVADITVPDGTQFAPNTGFNKTWRIRNTGTCTWDSRYRLIHHAGSLLGSLANNLPLPGNVAPGQTIDLTVSMVSPTAAGSYQSDWLLETPQGQPLGVGRSGSPFWVKIVVPGEQISTISGLVYQDTNQNGVYNSGEVLMGNREVLLFTGPACHVQSQVIASTLSNGSGRYTFNGNYEGSYCVGLAGDSGLDDVYNVAIAAGQTMDNINLRAPVAGSSITGFLWADYCLTDENGDALDGNCVADTNGDYHANGMIEPNEGYITGVTILLQAGSCGSGSPVAVNAVTDAAGKYFFGNLAAGTYCVSMNAASPENAPILLPGDWTFPSRGIWYQQITLSGSEHAYPVNFGWGYQLK